MSATDTGDRSNVPLELQRDGFTPDELRLGYTQWAALSEARRPHLAPSVQAWLATWTLWDLAHSPMDDAERRQIRYGHFLGWWDRWDYYERPNTGKAGMSESEAPPCTETMEAHVGYLKANGGRIDFGFVAPPGASDQELDAAAFLAIAEQAEVSYLAIGTQPGDQVGS